MVQQLQRTQILLEPEQHRALGEIARRQSRSLSDVVREIVQSYLHEQAGDEKKRRALEALQDLSRLREEIRQRHGIYAGNLVAEVRAEREAQLERSRVGKELP
jgi:hypothetical protein